ncbi:MULTISPECIES: hypothetical protein [Methylococcus]|uniref:Uncharacterized protein n=1 Tax=Methylococcus capsulatus TaxID=414 RepID=A0ABZ2F7Z9_METCP|nr:MULTISPECIES: hypothetical protein [Methylococcus]MDF9393849.1 hypothetical protein [Methylococcus capsulatus]
MWTWILNLAAKAWPILWRYFAPMLADGVRQQWEILLPITERMVKAVEDSLSWAPKSGEAKKQAAIALIVSELKAREIAWAEQIPARMMNRAIEMAVGVLPEKPAVETAP